MGSRRRVGSIGTVLLSVALGLWSPGCSKPESKPKGNQAKSVDRARRVPVGAGAMTRPLPPRPTTLAGRAAELYAQARTAWLAGKCEDAIRLAQQANRLKHSVRHISIIGACACSLQRKALAQWAYSALTGGNRNMLMSICRSKGIELGEPVADMDPVDPKDEPDANTAAGLYTQARSAWLGGECTRSIRLAQKANKLKYSSRHTMIIGACACALRDIKLAKWAYRRLRGNRNMLKNICRSKGIELK